MKDIKFYKALVFVNFLVPLALLAWDAYRNQLGANPLEFVTRTTGTLTLVFLLLSLAVTPLRKLTGVQWLIRFRRMVGLYAFFYGFLHLLTYVWFDKAFNLAAVPADVVRRPFIAVGMFAFFLMVPLAVTSTDKMIKRLGGKRWARLHKAAYVAAVGGVLHYYLLVKADTTKPLLFALVLALLLGYRLFAARQKAKVPVSIKVPSP
ncbi:MAG TPA: protein-methionine-sulfoxide reductase heme-binding subunit MsrQ [Pyrinomonadaceae bacterium]|nr:protein-methionine-sulfoxide reductase heme-binding subunit MsrQ [Pyrinomonadaceae bacterium]